MRANKDKILLLSAGGTQGMAFVKALHRDYDVHGVFDGKLNYGYFSRYFKARHIVSTIDDVDQYFQEILPIVREGNFAAIIPLSDESAELLSKYQDELSKYSRFVMPDLATFERGYDKHSLMAVCQKQGYPHPQTIILHDGLNGVDVNDLPYPLLIKPNHTCGGRGMTLAPTAADLLMLYPEISAQYGPCHLQHYVPAGGAQVEVQLYIDTDGSLVQSSVIYKYRWYPENGGSSCCARSHTDEHIVDICHKLLRDIGWVGFADFDTIQDPTTGQLLIMELNPRVPACVKTAIAAGIDWPHIIVDKYLGRHVAQTQPRPDIYLRHFGFEALWFVYSKNRFKTRPSWFKFIGRGIRYQDANGWADPLPFIMGSTGNLIKQLNPNFRKAKSGLR